MNFKRWVGTETPVKLVTGFSAFLKKNEVRKLNMQVKNLGDSTRIIDSQIKYEIVTAARVVTRGAKAKVGKDQAERAEKDPTTFELSTHRAGCPEESDGSSESPVSDKFCV